jgi:uncharacterized membrane protein
MHKEVTKSFINSPEIKACAWLTVLSLAMIFVRVVTKQELYYVFLVWNIFLAWIPLLFLNYAVNHENKGTMIYFLILWLLFLPNSPYIITDLLHLKNYGNTIIWYDTLLIFTFALTGLTLGLFSMKEAHVLLKRLIKVKITWLIILALNLLAGFGIYLGRYCRINTWDLFTKPILTFERIFHQFENPLALKICLSYGLVMFAFYFIYQQATSKKDLNLSTK